jgi:hypothetical protein
MDRDGYIITIIPVQEDKYWPYPVHPAPRDPEMQPPTPKLSRLSPTWLILRPGC